MRFVKIGLFILVAFFLAACGDNDEVENQQTNTGETGQEEAAENNTDSGNNDEDTVNNNNNGGDNTTNSEAEAPYVFHDFSFEANLDGTEDAIDVEYEYEPNETEASYKDQNSDINLSGDEAMQELDSIFSSFTFDESTDNEEVLNQVIEEFNIPENVQNLEVDIEFANGNEKEYVR